MKKFFQFLVINLYLLYFYPFYLYLFYRNLFYLFCTYFIYYFCVFLVVLKILLIYCLSFLFIMTASLVSCLIFSWLVQFGFFMLLLHWVLYPPFLYFPLLSVLVLAFYEVARVLLQLKKRGNVFRNGTSNL